MVPNMNIIIHFYTNSRNNEVIFHALWAQELQHFVWYHRDSSSERWKGAKPQNLFISLGIDSLRRHYHICLKRVISIPDAAA